MRVRSGHLVGEANEEAGKQKHREPNIYYRDVRLYYMLLLRSHGVLKIPRLMPGQ